MPNLTATIPHQLTRAEAKRRIQEQIAVLRHQQGELLATIQEKWTGDVMDFSLRAMGQSITGRLTIDDQAVHLDVALPWLLSVLANTIKQRIEQRITSVLSLPAAAPSNRA